MRGAKLLLKLIQLNFITNTLQILNCFDFTAFLKVRAAAVFALGRFIANTGDRSDQANQIDFGVAMTLTQLSLDGSPLVRKVHVYNN